MTSETVSNQEWLAEELSEVSLGDKRLNWRLLDTGAKLAARPSVSINQACDIDWARYPRRNYRLFDNENREKILAPIYKRVGGEGGTVRRESFCLLARCCLDIPTTAKRRMGHQAKAEADRLLASTTLLNEAGLPWGWPVRRYG